LPESGTVSIGPEPFKRIPNTPILKPDYTPRPDESGRPDHKAAMEFSSVNEDGHIEFTHPFNLSAIASAKPF
jgi:hypothetical protein